MQAEENKTEMKRGNMKNLFYPYGASRADCWSDSAMVQRWKYSGKELDSFQGLHCYDYGFRWYDPIVCRWTTPDPMWEKYIHILQK